MLLRNGCFTDTALGASPSLSNSFAFYPAGFLADLPDSCNRVDPAATAEVLRRSAPVEGLEVACAAAAARWSFSPWFRQRLAAIPEQAAFQKAAAGCGAEAALRVCDRISLLCAGEEGGAVLPKRAQCPRDRCVIDFLQEAAEALALRPSVLGVDRIVDVDVELACEEVGEGRVREVEHVTATANEIDEVVDQLQVDGAERAYGRFLVALGPIDL